MPNLSTLTSSDLHALVARSLEGVTEGPIEVWTQEIHAGGTAWRLRAPTFRQQAYVNSSKKDAEFYAQSRDLVPELDRRLRETEAKLEVAIDALKTISQRESEQNDSDRSSAASYSLCPECKAEGKYGKEVKHRKTCSVAISRAALTRIASLTQP